MTDQDQLKQLEEVLDASNDNSPSVSSSVPIPTVTVHSSGENTAANPSNLSSSFTELHDYQSQLTGWSVETSKSDSIPKINYEDSPPVPQNKPRSNSSSSVQVKLQAPKKKPTTKAERRAIQEEQRKRKAESNGAKGGGPQKGGNQKTEQKSQRNEQQPKSSSQNIKQIDSKNLKKQKQSSSGDRGDIILFSHLPQHKKIDCAYSNKNENSENSEDKGFNSIHNAKSLHSAIVSLGLKYSQETIRGSNARCVAMLTAFKEVIIDFKTSPNESLHRELDSHLKPQIDFLSTCRPISISMGNAINALKLSITKTIKMKESEAKEYLIDWIDFFIQEKIIYADREIASFGSQKIENGDTVLTHAYSSVVLEVFKAAKDKSIKFNVIIVDSRPKREGKELLRKLVDYHIQCSYILINAISSIIKQVSKIFVGAFGMLANGTLVSRCGTGLVTLIGHCSCVPVIVCCETYKFSEKVQLDAVSINELADPNLLTHPITGKKSTSITNSGKSNQKPNNKDSNLEQTSCSVLEGWEKQPNLQLLNLVYDATPSVHIDMVITEYGIVPPTSIPVIIREYKS